jgi:hypothetical protein
MGVTLNETITLSNGLTTTQTITVDDSDFPKVSSITWPTPPQ